MQYEGAIACGFATEWMRVSS